MYYRVDKCHHFHLFLFLLLYKPISIRCITGWTSVTTSTYSCFFCFIYRSLLDVLQGGKVSPLPLILVSFALYTDLYWMYYRVDKCHHFHLFLFLLLYIPISIRCITGWTSVTTSTYSCFFCFIYRSLLDVLQGGQVSPLPLILVSFALYTDLY